MEFTYQATLDDLIDFNIFQFIKNGKYNKLKMFFGFTIPIVLFISLYFVLGFNILAISIPLVLSITVLVLFKKVISNIISNNIKKIFKEKEENTFVGTRILKFAENSISLDNKKTCAVYTYDEILKVDKSKKYIFIYINAESAIIVPKSVFKNDSELDKVIELIKNKKERTV